MPAERMWNHYRLHYLYLTLKKGWEKNQTGFGTQCYSNLIDAKVPMLDKLSIRKCYAAIVEKMLSLVSESIPPSINQE